MTKLVIKIMQVAPHFTSSDVNTISNLFLYGFRKLILIENVNYLFLEVVKRAIISY